MDRFVQFSNLFLHFLTFYAIISQVSAAIRTYNSEEQQAAIESAAIECFKRMFESEVSTAPAPSGQACPIDFDGLACWSSTKAGNNATISCPHYIHLFDSREAATRHCTDAGHWALNAKNSTTADYFRCYEKSRNISNLGEIYAGNFLYTNSSEVHNAQYLSYLMGIYTAGNAISITALTLALALFAYFKKLLRCARNVIHANMFLSFILRGIFTLIQFFVISPHENNLDTSYTIDNRTGNLVTNSLQSSWECKLGTSLWMYTRLTNYTWIFIEAFYLHLLIFVLTFNDKQYKFRIIAAGWGAPLAFLLPWVITKLSADNYKCWLGFENYNLRWILDAPVLLIVLVNFGFFISFVKLLASKLNTSQVNGCNQKTGRRLAKSTFVIIPLFGVHYLLFIYADFHPNAYANVTLMWTAMFADAIFTSFQGLVVAVLFCFLNSEVKTEVQKIWVRLEIQRKIFSIKRAQRRSVTSDTAVTYTCRRHSGSNGLLNISMTSDSRAASLRRGVPVPAAIDEEHSQLISEKSTSDVNQNCVVESFMD